MQGFDTIYVRVARMACAKSVFGFSERGRVSKNDGN